MLTRFVCINLSYNKIKQMKLISRILTIIIFFSLGAFLTIFYIIPIFQKKLIKTTYPTSEDNKFIESTPIPENIELIQIPTTILIPTIVPTKKTTLTQTPTIIKNTETDNEPWGVAKQIGEHTWTMKIGQDIVMATATEILEALNNYRSLHGSQKLTMDSNLSEYAQSRADFFYQQEKLDSHQGFNNFLTNEGGFDKLGFSWLGENASYGYRLNGVHLIEWIYASDEDHNQNQLNNNWNYVGIGVKGTATCLIFGTGKR